MMDRTEANAMLSLGEATGEKQSRRQPEVPDHQMIRRIGAGSYGEVWLACSAVGTLRAVKVVYRDHFKDSRPYEREYSGIQRYEPISRTNEGLVDVLQIGRNDAAGYFYYVMELADNAAVEPIAQVAEARSCRTLSAGDPTPPLKLTTNYVPKTLSAELRCRGRLGVQDCITLGLTLNLALSHLHRNALIHRDVKPSNIIFVNGVPKLADIGLVTDVAEAESFVGTEGFIPPEGPNSPQADLYALGKVLYEASMGKDRQEFPEPRSDLGVDSESRALMELNAVLLRACASNPKQRYRSAEEMNADLALLHSGKSVKDRHALERRLRITTRVMAATVALVILGIVPYSIAIQKARAAQKAAAKSAAMARFLKNTFEGVAPSVAAGRDTALLKSLLDKAVERVRNELKDEPEARSELQNTFARVYRELGLLNEAADVARENIAQTTSALGAEHAGVAVALALLSDTLRLLGKFDEAEIHARKAVAVSKQVFGTEHPDYTAALKALGDILVVRGKLIEAQTTCSEALAINRRVVGSMNGETADALAALAKVLQARGQLAEAEVHLREALDIETKLKGAESFYAANIIADLSVLHARQLRLPEAESMARTALELYRKLVGPDHQGTSIAAANLAGILMQENKLSEAETLMRESYERHLKQFGPEHPDSITCLGNLALIISSQGRHSEAEGLFRQEIALAQKTKGNENLALGTKLNNLAGTLRALGKLDEAESMYRDAAAMKRKLAGDEDPDLPSILHNLADLLRARGKLQEAETGYRDSIAVTKKQLGAEHRRIPIMLHNFAFVLRSLDKVDEAEMLLREAIRVKKQVQPLEDLDLAKVHENLAWVLVRKGKWQEAEGLARHILEMRREKTPGEFGVFAAEALLGAALSGVGNSGEAEPLLVSGCSGMIEHLAGSRTPYQDRSHCVEGIKSLARLYGQNGQQEKEAQWKLTLARLQHEASDSGVAQSKR